MCTRSVAASAGKIRPRDLSSTQGTQHTVTSSKKRYLRACNNLCCNDEAERPPPREPAEGSAAKLVHDEQVCDWRKYCGFESLYKANEVVAQSGFQLIGSLSTLKTRLELRIMLPDMKPSTFATAIVGTSTLAAFGPFDCLQPGDGMLSRAGYSSHTDTAALCLKVRASSTDTSECLVAVLRELQIVIQHVVENQSDNRAIDISHVLFCCDNYRTALCSLGVIVPSLQYLDCALKGIIDLDFALRGPDPPSARWPWRLRQYVPPENMPIDSPEHFAEKRSGLYELVSSRIFAIRRLNFRLHRVWNIRTSAMSFYIFNAQGTEAAVLATHSRAKGDDTPNL